MSGTTCCWIACTILCMEILSQSGFQRSSAVLLFHIILLHLRLLVGRVLHVTSRCQLLCWPLPHLCADILLQLHNHHSHVVATGAIKVLILRSVHGWAQPLVADLPTDL